jgi:GTP cyclohydrolase II
MAASDAEKRPERDMTHGIDTNAIRRIASTRMPTTWGVFQASAFERDTPGETRPVETALAMIMGDVRRAAPLLRIHSQCITSEIFGSLRCDCSDQLDIAMRAIAEEGRGLLIYEHQEGRGIGLMAKLQAYSLQDGGLDTVEANEALGLKADYRTFAFAAAILDHLGIGRVRLLSNNPDKVRALKDAGIGVVERIPCEIPPRPDALVYLRSKKNRLGHLLALV